MLRYFSKYNAKKLKEEFAYIENIANELNDPVLIKLVQNYKNSLYEAIGDFDQTFSVPKKINLDGIANYTELPKVKESCKQ